MLGSLKGMFLCRLWLLSFPTTGTDAVHVCDLVEAASTSISVRTVISIGPRWFGEYSIFGASLSLARDVGVSDIIMK